MSGYEILWLTNGALNVESSSTPVNTNLVPKASILSEVLTYAILALVETYCPGINSDSVSCGRGCCHEGCAGSVRGYNPIKEIGLIMQ
jgi:hypothetical protein